MANPVSTSIDLGGVSLEGEAFDDDLLTFTGAATYSAGTILARDSGTLKFIAFVKGGVTAGNGIPKAVLTQDVTAAGAGDIKTSVLIKGIVKKQRLIILADGNDTNVDGAVKDQLRAFGITPVSVQQTSS